MAQKIYFESYSDRRDSSNYVTIGIDVIVDIEGYGQNKPIFTITWQKTVGEDGFYAGKIETKADYLEDFLLAGKIAKRVINVGLDDYFGIVSKLEKIGTEVKYDRRESRYVPLAEIKPATFIRYMDDYNQLGSFACSYDAIAETAEEARRSIMIQALEAGKDDFIDTFVASGKPVIVDQYSSFPGDKTAREIGQEE